MEFVVACLIDISDFILIGISFFFNSYDLIKGHYEGQGSSSAIQNHHLTVITNFMFTFLLDKTYLGF